MEPDLAHDSREALDDDLAGHNWRTYNRGEVVDDFRHRDSLYPAEDVVFKNYAGALRVARVLDIGVGGGRTASHLLSRCRSYRAVDYSLPMIAACRKRFPDCAPDVFAQGDARDLKEYPDEAFDFVLFSYNGLDYVDHDDRLRALAQIRRVLIPEGLYFFSTHSLHAFPFADPAVQANNRHVDADLLAARGWYHLIDRAPDVVTYYIRPDVQLRQLQSAGFKAIEVLDMKGQPFDLACPPRDWMVHFLCRRA